MAAPDSAMDSVAGTSSGASRGPAFSSPPSPVAIDCAFDDPDRMRRFVREGGPYWPTIRYVASEAELAALDSASRKMNVAPWFRADWAYGEAQTPGGQEVLENPRFAEAARQVFDAEVVRPLIVYVNVMGPMGAGPAHIDVPAFRGMDRTLYPVTFLHLMHRSGLFTDYRVDLATAVSWFYAGERGEFEYWAEGVEAPPRRIEAPLDNRAIVGDNDVMFHRVAAIGPSDPPSIEGASFGVELSPAPEGEDWVAVDQGRELIRYADRDVRVSISWKAEVFRDGEAARVREQHRDDLTLDQVVAVLSEDLAARGIEVAPVSNPASDPTRDEGFIRALDEAYPLPTPAS